MHTAKIFKIMAVDWGGIAQAGAGLLGSIFNATSAANTNEQTLRFTKEQQAQQNEFSKQEAEKARKFLARMDSTEFARRVSDMKGAGLNPAFAPMGPGDSVSSVPQASSSPVGSPHLTSPIVDPLTLSQIELNKSQAKKNEAEAENTEKQTDWMDVLNKSVIDYQGSCIDVNGSVVKLNEAQKQQIAQSIEESKQRIENLRKEIQTLDSQITLNDIDAFWKSGKYAAEIDQLKASARLSDSEAKELLYLMTSKKHLYEAEAASLRADVGLKSAQEKYYKSTATEHFWLGRMAYWDAGSSKISYQLYDKFGEFDKYFQYTTDGINTVCNVADQVLDWKKGLSQISQGNRRLDQGDRHLDQNERSLNQTDRRLDQNDKEFQRRQIDSNDRQYNADRNFKQRERFHNDMMGRFKYGR